MNPCLYIDTGFFKILSDHLKNGYDSADFDVHNRIRKFIFNPKITVVLDSENESDDQLYNDFVRVKGGQVMEANKSAAFEVKNSSDFENDVIKIGSKSPFSICLVSECKPELKSFVEESGYYCLDGQTVGRLSHLLFLKDKNLMGVNSSGDIKSWVSFKKLSHNFNTIVIMDRFLFAAKAKKTHSKYCETVSQIILNLASYNHSEVIDVLLVSVKNPKGDVALSLKSIREAIEKELKDNGLKKEVRISIARCKQSTDNNHDRIIFTNFCAMQSGNSFNYFESESLRRNHKPAINTTLNVHSFLDLDNWETILFMLKSRKKELPGPEDNNIPNEDLIEGDIDKVTLAKMI